MALAPYAINYAGVDVSAPNLEECERQATEAGFSGFQPILLIKPPEIELRVLRYEVDLFISTATFQHFPSQEYAVEVLNSVMRVMANGGLGVIQIRFDNGNPKYADKNPTTASAYAKDYLTATSFRLDAFWDLLLSAGFVPEACRSIKTSNNYATFLIRKPSAA